MLLRWQALVLNQLYQTKLFDQIIIQSTILEQIDYSVSIDVYKEVRQIDEVKFPLQKLHIWQFLGRVHTLCKGQSMIEKKESVILFQRVLKQLSQEKNNTQEEIQSDFSIFHVILFSSLSKCTIWPAMFKTSKTLIPTLIDFYNQFFNHYSQFLQYKFDPLILSHKYTNIVKKIKQKRLANPELFKAIQTSNIIKIKELVSNTDEKSLNQYMQNGLYVGHSAALHSDLPTLRLLHELKVDFQLLDEEHQTPIFYAVKRFQLDVVRFFVQEIKVNINHTEYQNRTAIYLAAFQGNIQIVKYLYSQGADPSIESKLARTPLSKACYLGNIQVAQFLIEIGVKIDSQDSKGRTALHNAAWGVKGGRLGKRRGHIQLEDSPECGQLLLKAGHPIDFQDFDKFTPLFSSISSHAERSLRMLVKYGANLTHKTIKNQSAVFIACKYGHLKIIKILTEDYDCNFQQSTVQGYTPLMAALTQTQKDCARYMLTLYMRKDIKLEATKKMLECLLQYQKWDNLRYLMEWVNESDGQMGVQKKGEFLGLGFEYQIDELLGSVFSIKSDQKINTFLTLVEGLQPFLSKRSMKAVIDWVQKTRHFNDSVIRMLLTQQSKGLPLPRITLCPSLSEQVLIKLLEVDSNLTESPLSLYNTIIQVVKNRSTKVILAILRQVSLSQRKEGVRRYLKQQLTGIIFGQIEGKISVIDYCLINGYYDMHKLLCSLSGTHLQHNNHSLKHAIPNYQFRAVQLQQPTRSYLMPIPNAHQLLNFQHLTDTFLTAEQRQLYFQVKKDISCLVINPIMVDSLQSLQQMQSHLNTRHMIGIDIEHYSSRNESFICLIQIATLQQVFILDKFSSLHKQIQLFLRGLFADESKIKIFHSYNNDLKWLTEEYCITEFYSIFDTARIYGLMEQHKTNTPSLKWLAQQFLNLEIKKEYQQSDWRIRPLFPQMADYAATDAKVLPFLLLAMLENISPNKITSLQLLKYMQSKRLLKLSHRQNTLQFI